MAEGCRQRGVIWALQDGEVLDSVTAQFVTVGRHKFLKRGVPAFDVPACNSSVAMWAGYRRGSPTPSPKRPTIYANGVAPGVVASVCRAQPNFCWLSCQNCQPYGARPQR